MRRPRRIDRLGALLTGVGGLALACSPFVVFKPNRILPGVSLGILVVLHGFTEAAVTGIAALAVVAALFSTDARLRLATSLAAFAAIALAAAAAGNTLTPPGDLIVRIAPGAGCWLALACCGLLATDAITRMRPGPGMRVLLLAIFLAAAVAALAHGTFDHLSVMREYRINAGRFAFEARRHVELAFGSLGAALLAGLPLGIGCHRVPRLRAATLSALNFVQTIPSIALFGILMAPLAAFAAAVPLAARIGIAGIGPAPAVVALFLYSLLPIVANTVAGLGRVSPAAVEAARGMGMTGGEILFRVELPLALPVILTGVRIVLVQNIGLVTIAALIGAGGLGAFVFQGIGETANDLVLLGALPTVALAIASSVLLDALIEVVERVKR
ncbi:MAG TPA: ABC transporter permease [Steroidobacteraceae bacterium]|nr:ABC transporter permease [Steroidobacteraceae bacterium]